MLTQTQPARRLLRVPEVAWLLGVSTKTVYRLLNKGELAGVRVGKALRVRPADVEAYIQEGATT